MAVYKDGKKTSDLNVQADFNVEDTTSDAYVKNRPDSTLSISFNGVVQERTYNPNTGNEVININIDNLIKERNDKITEAVENLDASDTLTPGNYYTGMTEKDGIVSMTQSDMDTTPTENSMKPVTSGGVRAAINSLDSSDTLSVGNYYTGVTEKDGIINMSQAAMDTAPTLNSSKPVTSGGVLTALNNAIDSLDASDTLDQGKYYTGIKEENGVISMTQSDMDTTPTENSKKPVTSGGVKSYIDNAIDALDSSSTLTSGNYYTGMKETNGVVVMDQAVMDSTPTENSKKPVTSGGVKSAISSEASARNTAISTAVSAEATARDEAISTAISAEVTNRNTAISNAVKALDGIVTGTAGAANTLTAFSEEDGKVSATFGAIQIASSQVTGLDTALAGKQEKGSYKTVQTAVSSPTASGTSLSFIDSVSQNTNGVITATKKAVTTMGAATASANGTAGLVPAPAAGAQAKYLRADGTWNTPTNTTYSAATTSDAGLMSAADKIKLDGIATGANNYTYILQTATATILGGVKSKATGTTANRDYNVQVNSDGTMKVNVPWTDNNTTYGVVSTTAAGLVPKGTAVSTQSQSTKFLREDGTWAAPSYSSGNSLTIGTGANQAAAGNHTHSQYLTSHQDISGKLNRSGDILTIKGDKYSVNNEYGINMANSDIVGANAIVFNDNAEAGEGLIFSNDAKSSFDSIRMEGGELKITTGSSNSSCKDGHSYSISVVNAW